MTRNLAIYARLSTVEAGSKGQIQALRRYARVRGFRIVATLVDRKKGSNDRRPQRRTLFTLVREGKIDAVLVPALQELARSTDELLLILEGLERHGVRLLSQGEGINTGTASGELLLRAVRIVVRFREETIAESVRAGHARARREGKRIGRPPADRRKVIRARKLRRKGLSVREVADRVGLSKTAVQRLTTTPARLRRPRRKVSEPKTVLVGRGTIGRPRGPGGKKARKKR